MTKNNTSKSQPDGAKPLLCATLSFEELKSKIGHDVFDESNQIGKLINVMDNDGVIMVFIDCCSNAPYWMKAKYVWLCHGCT